MKVYRILSSNELKYILDEKTHLLGASCENFPIYNTHIYNKNKKYMHFFLKQKSLNYFYNLPNYNYECTFNIPISILIRHKGYGFYPSKNESENRGYDSISKKVCEFAIPAEMFNSKWLVSYKKVERKNENKFSITQ